MSYLQNSIAPNGSKWNIYLSFVTKGPFRFTRASTRPSHMSVRYRAVIMSSKWPQPGCARIGTVTRRTTKMLEEASVAVEVEAAATAAAAEVAVTAVTAVTAAATSTSSTSTSSNSSSSDRVMVLCWLDKCLQQKHN